MLKYVPRQVKVLELNLYHVQSDWRQILYDKGPWRYLYSYKLSFCGNWVL